MKLSLKQKIILSILGIIAFFGLLATLTTFFITRNTFINLKKQELLTTVTLQSHETNQIFTQSQNLTSFAAEQALIIAAFVFFAALTATVVISALVSNFLKPLAKLKEFSLSLSQGHLDQQIKITTGDELEDLAKVLNSMAKNLKTSRMDIEKKIKDRTAQLEKLNQAMVGRELKMVELKKKIRQPTKKSWKSD